MRSILPALLLLTPALHAAEETTSPARKKLPAISLLPNGSELNGVLLPRYDENHRLAGVLKAATITLVNEEVIAGDQVVIGFSNPDGSPRGHIHMASAILNQIKGILETRDSVIFQSDKLNATGTGLYYTIEQGEGFLTGPATTWIQAPIETTMHSSPSPLRATALAGISLVTQSLAAVPPPSADPAALKTVAAPAAGIHADTARVARMDLRTDLDAAISATAKAKAFLEQAELVAAKPSAAPPAEAKPLDVNPGPRDTVITCDGGMYFDADEGVFVYLKNVRVNDPRFTLTGANELKILLSKKPGATQTAGTEPKAAAKDQPGLGLGAKFGDVERIIATGAVRILQKEVAPDKQPVEASGAIFSYHPETGLILLSGGYPWVKQGATFMRAKEPELTLRIQKNGSFVTEGNWDMGGTLSPE